jgi:hypothetical protein
MQSRAAHPHRLEQSFRDHLRRGQASSQTSGLTIAARETRQHHPASSWHFSTASIRARLGGRCEGQVDGEGQETRGEDGSDLQASGGSCSHHAACALTGQSLHAYTAQPLRSLLSPLPRHYCIRTILQKISHQIQSNGLLAFPPCRHILAEAALQQ